MGSNGFTKKTRSVFSASEETVMQARRYCARQVTGGRMDQIELKLVLLALGLDETVEFSNDVRPQDYYLPLMGSH